MRTRSEAPPARAFEKVCELAEGGMGRVDLVVRRESGFARLHAQKRLHREHREDRYFRAMFLDEARISGLIRHANVVSVLDVGEDEDGPFLLMDYVEGVPLSELVHGLEQHGDQMPVQLCARIGAQIAHGLHATHELESSDGERLQLVHRDVSPPNVLIGYDGGPDWNTNGSIEGTCPTCCVNVVQEGACEASGEDDCVWQGGQTLGHRLQPGLTGGIVGSKSFARVRTFGITYALRYSAGYVDPTVAQKTNELGDGLHCFLGCSTFNSTGRNVPFQAVFFTSGAANAGTLVTGEQGPNDGFYNFSPSPADYEWRVTHGPGEWVCHQLHFDGWGTANATIRYFVNGAPVVHVANLDMSNVAYDPEGIGSIAWNHYYNDGYPGSDVAYRYEDNVHITAGAEPISCEAIGLGSGPGPSGAGGSTSSAASGSATSSGAGGSPNGAYVEDPEDAKGCACRFGGDGGNRDRGLGALAVLLGMLALGVRRRVLVGIAPLWLAACGHDDASSSSNDPDASSAAQGAGGAQSSGAGATSSSSGMGGNGSGGGLGGPGIASDYPGDVGIEGHPSVLFFEDFEDADVGTLAQSWDSASTEAVSLDADVPAGAVGGSHSLLMSVESGAGTTGVTFYKSLPTQHGAVHVRYYVKYVAQANYHHAGMWIGGFDPPTAWPQGTAGIRPSGSDFFHNAFEPHEEGGSLLVDHYAQWPSMDCWMEPGGCYGNVFMRDQEPSVPVEAWSCIELMLKVNTPGQSDGEYAVWIDDALIQHLAPGTPNFERLGNGVWLPDPNGTPFPGFDWTHSQALGFNWIWLDFYVDAGPSSMRWDQIVVATERVGCMTPG